MRGPKDRSGAAAAQVLVLLATGTLTAILLAALPRGAAPSAATVVPEGFPGPEDRAVAFGLMLDAPRPPEVTEKALVVAEQLRLRFGIDTGNPHQDRETAARRVQAELLDRLVFEEAELEAMATELGFSLDPAQCANYCENVRQLAELELKRRALEAFAEGRAHPGRVAESPPEGPPLFSGEPPGEDGG